MMPNPINRKVKRNQSIKRYQRDHPKCSMQNIGRIYHLSKQRVSVILNNKKGGTL